VLLRDRYGIDVPAGVNLHSDPANVVNNRTLAEAGRRHVRLTSSGLNHFIWLLDIHDRQTGEDLYPALRAAIDKAPPTLEPFSMDLFRVFGYCPLPGDTHLAEYMPYLHDPVARPWETYQLPLYDWSGNEGVREFLLKMMSDMAAGAMPVDGLREAESEGAAEVIVGIGTGNEYFDETVNVPNRGAIPNLPDETIVEIPAMVGSYGIRPVRVGPLPRGVAELCRREAELVEMVVDTAVSGDRTLALQTLLLDPMINDIGRARAVLDDYLRTFEAVLPQF
jgi:alpha-galactosidase